MIRFREHNVVPVRNFASAPEYGANFSAGEYAGATDETFTVGQRVIYLDNSGRLFRRGDERILLVEWKDIVAWVEADAVPENHSG